jgi:hypothetical protein
VAIKAAIPHLTIPITIIVVAGEAGPHQWEGMAHMQAEVMVEQGTSQILFKETPYLAQEEDQCHIMVAMEQMVGNYRLDTQTIIHMEVIVEEMRLALEEIQELLL